MREIANKKPRPCERGVFLLAPGLNTQLTKSKVISEEIPWHYRWHNKHKTLFRGPKPDFIPKGRIVSKKEMRHYQYVQTFEGE